MIVLCCSQNPYLPELEGKETNVPAFLFRVYEEVRKSFPSSIIFKASRVPYDFDKRYKEIENIDFELMLNEKVFQPLNLKSEYGVKFVSKFCYELVDLDSKFKEFYEHIKQGESKVMFLDNFIFPSPRIGLELLVRYSDLIKKHCWTEGLNLELPYLSRGIKEDKLLILEPSNNVSDRPMKFSGLFNRNEEFSTAKGFNKTLSKVNDSSLKDKLPFSYIKRLNNCILKIYYRDVNSNIQIFNILSKIKNFFSSSESNVKVDENRIQEVIQDKLIKDMKNILVTELRKRGIEFNKVPISIY